MPLRKSPLRTLAALAARRANAPKSTGPKTLRGKARASLNALKHGRYAVHLRRKLLEAGDRQGEALYARIEARVTEAFCSSGWIPASAPRSARAEGMTGVSTPRSTAAEGMAIPEKDERELRRLTSLVWCFAAGRQPQRLPHPKTNLECALESMGCDVRDLLQRPFQVQDGRRRIGLVFWVQRRRTPGWKEFWERFRNGFGRLAVALDRAGLGGVGLERTGPEPTGPKRTGPQQTGAEPRAGAGTGFEQVGVAGTIFERLGALAGVGERETGLRSRIFRLRRPNIWARLHYGLDKDGVYSPKIEARGRRELKKLCLAGIPVSSWPSVLSPDIDCSLIPYGFENEP